MTTDEADPTAPFEALYAAAADGGESLPWDRGGPHPLVEEWASEVDGAGRRAVVVGCGLGTDAELMARRGFSVVGFDVSPSAVAGARRRHPGSEVEYRVGDLLDLPPEWTGAFDLVVESLTVQSLPPRYRARLVAGVASLVAPGGILLVVSWARGESDEPVEGPPWPLTRREVGSFAEHGLQTIRIEHLLLDSDAAPRWRAEFRRP